jgi:hypothetical protein
MSCRFWRSIGRGKCTLVEEEVIMREASGRAGETKKGWRGSLGDCAHGTAMARVDVVNVVMHHRRRQNVRDSAPSLNGHCSLTNLSSLVDTSCRQCLASTMPCLFK